MADREDAIAVKRRYQCHHKAFIGKYGMRPGNERILSAAKIVCAMLPYLTPVLGSFAALTYLDCLPRSGWSRSARPFLSSSRLAGLPSGLDREQGSGDRLRDVAHQAVWRPPPPPALPRAPVSPAGTPDQRSWRKGYDELSCWWTDRREGNNDAR